MVHDSPVMKSALACALAIAVGALPSAASAAPGDKVDIGDLADLGFGQLNMTTDQTLSENVCAYSNSGTAGYAVQAIGDGSAGAFTLSNGSATLPYLVRWADSPGGSVGSASALTAGVSLAGFTSPANNKNCTGGPAATLLVTIQGTAAGSAQVGDYSGVLTLTLTPQ
jgi:hypothetical protein